jgi:hypothetical protein
VGLTLFTSLGIPALASRVLSGTMTAMGAGTVVEKAYDATHDVEKNK